MDEIKLKKTQENKVNLKKGVSLIVLVITIIVIIILAAAVILTLTNNNPIENAKQAAFVNDLSSFQDELNMYKANEYAKSLGNFDPATLNADSTNATLLYTYIPSLEGKTKYENEIEVVAGKLRYTGIDDKKITWATSVNIETGETPILVGANAPVLATGMTPIKWSGTTMVDTTSSDATWYDYSAKQWANARTADGSMWVWIPRYEYQIPTPHSSTAQTIAVNFINGTSTTTTSGYIMHPAFTFGTDELTGIWVAKFEASGTTTAVDVKPGIESLRSITIDAMFTACRDMETNTAKYGWSTTDLDTHLMKNVEWGAAAYLSSSAYGKTGEITINANSSFFTGGGINNEYITNVAQSTTGTVYGIYDMSGGAWEYTAAYVNNGSTKLTTDGASLTISDSKYKDVYVSIEDTMAGNYSANLNKKGDAVYETSTAAPGSTAWYGDYSYMPYLDFVFFLRGGFYNNGETSGVFSFHNGRVISTSYYGFRPCLVVSNAQ